jgi:hypothetical protein
MRVEILERRRTCPRVRVIDALEACALVGAEELMRCGVKYRRVISGCDAESLYPLHQ